MVIDGGVSPSPKVSAQAPIPCPLPPGEGVNIAMPFPLPSREGANASNDVRSIWGRGNRSLWHPRIHLHAAFAVMARQRGAELIHHLVPLERRRQAQHRR